MAREGDDPRAIRAGLSVYRCVLRLYPPTFRNRFADDLEDDFRSMSQDAWKYGGPLALMRWWAETVFDAVRSLCREWMRTPWLPISLVSAAIAAGVFWAGIGRAQLGLRVFRRERVPGAPPPPDSPELLLLMGLMILIPIVAVLAFWALSRLIRHESPPRRKMS